MKQGPRALGSGCEGRLIPCTGTHNGESRMGRISMVMRGCTRRAMLAHRQAQCRCSCALGKAKTGRAFSMVKLASRSRGPSLFPPLTSSSSIHRNRTVPTRALLPPATLSQTFSPSFQLSRAPIRLSRSSAASLRGLRWTSDLQQDCRSVVVVVLALLPRHASRLPPTRPFTRPCSSTSTST